MLMNYYRHIDRTQVQFDFLCNKSKPGEYDDEIRDLGGRVFCTPGYNLSKYAKYASRMKELKEENGYTIIHVHNGALGAYALYMAKKSHYPVRIYHAHGTGIAKDGKRLVKLLYKTTIPSNLTHRFACGSAAAGYYYGRGVEKAEDYTLIPNAITIEKFLYNEDIRREIRAKYHLANKHLVGHVGRFAVEKNHVFLLDVFAAYKKCDPKAHLVMLGDGELMQQVKDRACYLGLQNDVLFAGRVTNVNEWYQALDVMVMTSFREGLPVVGVEAQTADLPCVFSDTITREIGILDTTRFVSLNAPVDTWAETIHEVMNRRKRKNVRDVITAHGYDIEMEAKKLQNIYLELARLSK